MARSKEGNREKGWREAQLRANDQKPILIFANSIVNHRIA